MDDVQDAFNAETATLDSELIELGGVSTDTHGWGGFTPDNFVGQIGA